LLGDGNSSLYLASADGWNVEDGWQADAHESVAEEWATFDRVKILRDFNARMDSQ